MTKCSPIRATRCTWAGWLAQGDYGLIAEQDDAPVGAAWYRTYTEVAQGHGFVAEEIPELSIAVIAPRRHEGIGRLMRDEHRAQSDASFQWSGPASIR